METMLATKVRCAVRFPTLSDARAQGTGIVTSVQSNSPHNYATRMELCKKPEHYRIEPAWAAIDPVPVIATSTYGQMTTPASTFAPADACFRRREQRRR
ncbi:hypothetical protein EIP86_009445 [Pleurotus ostreatoroseus]|nr:hypothetical protein EIP86_009445 [Pleurotus ostreatoroseus]